jgi:Ca-activated chloride channel homolog
VILAIDVSGSMRAADMEPSRLVAAQEAAKTFITRQPADVEIGIVAFAGRRAGAEADARPRRADHRDQQLRSAARHGGGLRRADGARDHLPDEPFNIEGLRDPFDQLGQRSRAAPGDREPVARRSGTRRAERTCRSSRARTRMRWSSC